VASSNQFETKGFTLIELLTVIGIIGLLLALLAPAVQSVRSSVRNLECQNKMRQIGLALQMHADSRSVLPAGTNITAKREFLSWCVPILPYLEQRSAYELSETGFASGGSVFNVVNHPLIQLPNTAYACPEDARVSASAYAKHNSSLVGLTSYLGCSGLNYIQQDGVLFAGSAIRFSQIMDGLSTTILIGERPPSVNNDIGWWYAGVGGIASNPSDQRSIGCLDHTLGVKELCSTPYSVCQPANSFFHFPSNLNDECNANFYWSLHRGGANFVMCDGSVHFKSYSDATVLEQLSTRNGREVSN
jgi:prepilin-type N-terminal cleavage/methylation domain-containing protein/prepilin-type processing-associated H-X9-DG protein